MHSHLHSSRHPRLPIRRRAHTRPLSARSAVLALTATAACASAGSATSPGAPLPGDGRCGPDAEATTLAGVDACVEEVRFRSGDLTLAGQWFAPPGGGPHPAAVFLRGSGESSRGNAWTESIAAVLVGEGAGVLIPDKRGSGASEGDWRSADFEELAADALAAVRHLAARPDVTLDRIGVVGLSQGGMVAPVAAARSDSVAFAVSVVGSGIPLLESVRFEMLHTFREEGLSGERLEAAMALVDTAVGHVLGTVPWDAYAAALERARPVLGERIAGEYFIPTPDHWRWEFFRGVADFDAAEWWRRIDRPALVLLGAEDTNTPTPESARRLRAAFQETGHPDATVVVFEGLGHALWNTSGPMSEHGLDERVRETLASWIRRVVVERP